MKKDGHVHTPFCPHGTDDSFELYIETAIKKGFSAITFTEHAPLPEGFVDPTPDKDSAMPFSDIDRYLSILLDLKKQYKRDIDIHIGLEVDYINGFERETAQYLDKYGPFLDDSILSVHFLKLNGQYYCVDFDEHTFQKMAELSGGINHLYELYYATVLKGVVSDLGKYKPKRLGHITLIRKFQKLFQATFDEKPYIEQIFAEMNKRGMELDVNTSGLRKAFCGEIYPPEDIIQAAKKQSIPLVYGSDAHSAKDVGSDFSLFEKMV
ncbi:histidinol-phosphatase HisJ [Aeribacillus sp. SP014]